MWLQVSAASFEGLEKNFSSEIDQLIDGVKNSSSGRVRHSIVGAGDYLYIKIMP